MLARQDAEEAFAPVNQLHQRMLLGGFVLAALFSLIGWLVARRITHAGAVGHFALQAAAAGMVGMVMTASVPLMAWPGSRGAVVSTNPIAIAIPAAGRAPLLLDMSTATVALGRIMAERMTQSWTSAPHFYLFREVNGRHCTVCDQLFGRKPRNDLSVFARREITAGRAKDRDHVAFVRICSKL